MRRPRRPPPPPRHPPAAPATRPSPLRSRAPSASYRPPHVAAAAPSAHSSQIMPRRRRRPISAARVPAGAPRPDPSAGAAAAHDLHCLNDLARHPSHQHRRPSCLRDFDPVRFAAEGGVPREDDGQQLQLQGVHGAPQGHLLPLALRRQRPEALQAPRHAALRRVPPLLLQYIEDSVAVSMSDMEPFPATTNEICNIGTKGFPNRWWHVIAPGLLNSGFRKATKLAKGIAMWWMQTNYASYKAIGSMHEEVEHIPSQQECSVRQQDLWKIEEPLSLVGETIFLCTVVLPYEQFVSFSEFLDRITIHIFC